MLLLNIFTTPYSFGVEITLVKLVNDVTSAINSLLPKVNGKQVCKFKIPFRIYQRDRKYQQKEQHH